MKFWNLFRSKKKPKSQFCWGRGGFSEICSWVQKTLNSQFCSGFRFSENGSWDQEIPISLGVGALGSGGGGWWCFFCETSSGSLGWSTHCWQLFLLYASQIVSFVDTNEQNVMSRIKSKVFKVKHRVSDLKSTFSVLDPVVNVLLGHRDIASHVGTSSSVLYVFQIWRRQKTVVFMIKYLWR